MPLKTPPGKDVFDRSFEQMTAVVIERPAQLTFPEGQLVLCPLFGHHCRIFGSHMAMSSIVAHYLATWLCVEFQFPGFASYSLEN